MPIATPTPAPARPPSLGVVFFTLYLDLVAFSLFFPLGPQLLKYYLAHERADGVFAALVHRLDALATAGGAGPTATAALFAGALGSVYALMQFLFSPAWGARSDRVGRRPVLLLTVAGAALGYLALTVSASFPLFLLCRLFSGLMAGNLAVAVAAVSDLTSRKDRARGMGVVGAAFGLGFLTGPALGAATAHLSLLDRWPGLAAWGVHPFSFTTLLAAALAAGNFLWVAARFRETLPPARRDASAAAAGRNPLRALFTLPDPALRRANLVVFLLTFAFSFFETTISFFAADRLGYGPRQLMWIFVHLGLVSLFTQGWLVRRVAPALGEKTVALLGLALLALGLAALGFVVGVARSAPLMFVALTVWSVGSGFATVGLSALVSLYAPPAELGRVLGLYRSMGSLARAVSPVVAGLLFFQLGGTLTFAAAAVLLLAPLALGFALPRPAP